MTTTAANIFLSGNYAPVHEEVTVDNLTVIGELPGDLAGMYVRNGPNPQFTPPGRYHWFDGDGMLHGVHLKDGKASYRNRYIRTEKFTAEHAEGRALIGGLLEMDKLAEQPPISMNAGNTALVWHDRRLFALWEGGPPHEIKLPDLETVGLYTYDGKLVSAFTAHPKVDPVTGEMIFFGYSPVFQPYVQYSVVSAQGQLLSTVPIDLPVGVMIHDFAITEHYTIFMDLPMTFRLERVMRGEPIVAFEPELPARFGILPRHGDNSTVRWFEMPSCWVWHTLNAYEDGDEVVLLACRANSTGLLGTTDAALGQGHEHKFSTDEADRSRMHCWRFNLVTGAVKEQQLDDVPTEFPRINEHYMGRQLRYGYAARGAVKRADGFGAFDGLLKYDLQSGSTQVYELGAHQACGESVFSPRPGAAAEDDGWLLTYAHDYATNQAELLVVHAQDVAAGPVARVLIPRRIPFGFHGTWVAEDQLAQQR